MLRRTDRRKALTVRLPPPNIKTSHRGVLLSRPLLARYVTLTDVRLTCMIAKSAAELTGRLENSSPKSFCIWYVACVISYSHCSASAKNCNTRTVCLSTCKREQNLHSSTNVGSTAQQHGTNKKLISIYPNLTSLYSATPLAFNASDAGVPLG